MRVRGLERDVIRLQVIVELISHLILFLLVWNNDSILNQPVEDYNAVNNDISIN